MFELETLECGGQLIGVLNFVGQVFSSLGFDFFHCIEKSFLKLKKTVKIVNFTVFGSSGDYGNSNW